jgi:hypothetical protein
MMHGQQNIKIEKVIYLGAFAKLRKATIGIVLSVRPSFRPHGTSRLPVDGFS